MIVVYGAGGVGTFFGGLMARAGHDVQFVARGAQLAALRAGGLRIESSLIGNVDVAPVAAHDRARGLGDADIVLVCVKAHQTAGILEDLREVVGERTVIVPLQNGVESDEELAASFGWSRVASAVVYVGATLERPGLVRHVAAGVISIGARPGFEASRLPQLGAALSAPGIQVRISTDIQFKRWEKLIWNASFNPVSAITGRDPAALLALAPTRALIVAVMREVAAVAAAQGLGLSNADADAAIAWTEGAGAIRTSMMVDRERGRTMETDALVGVIVRKGREHGVPTPCSDALYALLSSIVR